MVAVWDRIDAELARRNMSWAELGRVIDATDQAMHNWKSRGVPAARHKAIAGALGWSVDRLIADNWTPAQPATAGVSVHPVAQNVIQLRPHDESPLHAWEFILSVPATDLPKRFRAAMPDDALAPDTPRGVVLQFSTELSPTIGHGVLVQDAAGGRHVRRYAQGLGDAWRAEARNTAYMTLHSGDGVQLLAVVTGRDSGVV